MRPPARSRIRRPLLFLQAVLLLLLSGCWDAKEIQDVAYVSAIGVDYEDQLYRVYVQLISFGNVAKTEGATVGTAQKAPIWVGTGVGQSLNEAFFDLYGTSQLRLFWGHVTSLVYSERFIRKGLNELIDLVNRYREIRYTKWVFGTSEPIDKLFATSPLFNLTPLSSILHQPGEPFRQNSVVVPLQSQRFISLFNEPAETVLLPRLELHKGNWKMEQKPLGMLRMHGAFAFAGGKFVGTVQHESFTGLRWLHPETIRTPLHVYKNGELVAALVMNKPKPRLECSARPSEGQVKCRLRLTVHGSINELSADIGLSALEHEAAAAIENQIRDAYQAGVKQKLDLLQIGNTLYKKQPAQWHELFADQFPLNEQSLESIQVQAHILFTGKYKNQAAR
ncbi:Ger(x)C family spore germination protein [Paenibacillus oceani]|uniref:Ger(X)C family spore germination protein n=1 Tax=Paenibacillus oceani TaxID=2772510 RepID=A0A927CB66_9BACL|nr:Ger(x)C family spore germination protein [Paenibacillus oceani]MBD2863453.1 Ger(x)C family spore germination protein [Paenibacillus oceani]